MATLAEAEIELLGPVAVTSRARTVVDCARRLAPHDALAVADAACQGRVDKAVLREALARCGSTRGSRRAGVVIELADGRRETALESWSAWAFGRVGLPRPAWQATVLDHEGVLIGRADAWWEQGVVGEADGRAKYRLKSLERRGVVDAEGLAQALDDERRRERELARSGARIVRWEPRDVLEDGRTRTLADHVRRTLGAASRERAFTGTVLLL